MKKISKKVLTFSFGAYIITLASGMRHKTKSLKQERIDNLILRGVAQLG